MSFTGSTRKLFSVGLALRQLGADHRIDTPVYRLGEVAADGTLTGALALVGAGDLAFGGRRIDADTVDFTTFDHNDANGLGTAILSPQDPLYALDELAAEVRAAGITAVAGDVVVDPRLFEPVPGAERQAADLAGAAQREHGRRHGDPDRGRPAGDGRPTVPRRPPSRSTARSPPARPAPRPSVTLSDGGLIECLGEAGCHGTVSGDIPVDYEAPLSGEPTFVGTFRVEDPDAFMRTAFIEALARHGVDGQRRRRSGPTRRRCCRPRPYDDATRGSPCYESAPYGQTARLVLKVSLNLGANLALSLFGVEQGAADDRQLRSPPSARP